MAYTRHFVIDFGPSKGGLSTVGYKLTGGSRITAGVSEIVEYTVHTGAYEFTATIPDGFTGRLTADTGEVPPIVVSAAINPGDDEYTDAKSSAAATPELAIPAGALDDVLDQPNAIDGGSIREALQSVAAVLAGEIVASPNSDGTATATSIKAFKDPDTVRITATATRTGRTVEVS